VRVAIEWFWCFPTAIFRERRYFTMPNQKATFEAAEIKKYNENSGGFGCTGDIGSSYEFDENGKLKKVEITFTGDATGTVIVAPENFLED
jgi:hypothetical protein